MPDDQGAAIFDIAKECLKEFDDKARDDDDRDLMTRPFKRSNLSRGYNSHRECDFMGLRDIFILWNHETLSSSDAGLQDCSDVSSMFVELLEMILRSLRCRE